MTPFTLDFRARRGHRLFSANLEQLGVGKLNDFRVIRGVMNIEGMIFKCGMGVVEEY